MSWSWLGPSNLVNCSTGIMAWMPCCLVKAVPGGWWPHTLNRLSADTPGTRQPVCFMLKCVPFVYLRNVSISTYL